MPPLLGLLILALPARAQTPPACLPLMSVGCSLERPGAPRLLIYHRGHLTEPLPGETAPRGGERIPPELLAVSAAQAVAQYDLARVAAALDASLIVTGSSAVGLDAAVYARGRPVILAAHSGGIVGLSDTMSRATGELAAVVLLDCFYGEDGGLAEAASQVADALRAWPMAACGGFYTPHNASRLGRIFLPSLGETAKRCRLDRRGADEHNSAVADELVRAIRSPLFLNKPALTIDALDWPWTGPGFWDDR